jgi:HEAT repeat protein
MITGYEPRISSRSQNRERAAWRLAARNVAHMLRILPDDAITLEAIEAALSDNDFLVRSSAAKRLIDRNDRQARMVLQRVLDTGSGPARANIARHLFGLTWFSAEPMFEQAFADNDYRVREGAAYSLCTMGTLEAYQFLIGKLEHETHDQVLGAPAMEWGLHGSHDPLAVEVLKMSLKSSDPEIRAKAMEAFSTTEARAAIEPVRDTMLNDLDEHVIYHATLSYVELLEAACIEDFAKLFPSTTDAQRLRPMLRGFFHATNYRHVDVSASEHVDALIDALQVVMQHPSRKVRWQAIWCLAWMKSERTPAIIANLYHVEQDIELKAHFLNVAVNLMSEGSDKLLEDALASDEESLQREALQLVENFKNAPE